MRTVLNRLRALLRRRKLENEMAEEIQLHLEHRADENMAAGLDAETARHAALRRFGGVEQVKEVVRERRGWLWLEQLMQDLRFAARTLVKARGFSAVAILTLALGIGVTTALYSVVHGVLLDPYPYAKSSEIWAPQIRDAKTGRGTSLLVSDYLALAKLPGVASAMATSQESAMLRGETTPEVVTAPRISSTAFEFLGVAPVLGRVFGPGDFRPNGEAEAVTVLSFKLWHRLFNGDPAVAGRTLVVNDKPHVILGVMPPRFGWWTNDGLWLPLTTLDPQTRVAPIVRLKPGVTQTVAEQQLLTRFRELAAEAPNRFPKDGITATFSNYLDVTVSSGQMRSSLVLLFYAVGFLLLIACTNVANLQLARAAARGREIAVRLAVGASRGRVVRQLLTESVTLALLGGVVGVLIAYGLTQIIVALMPNFYVPNEARVTMNGWVLGFSVVISVLTGVLFGLAPGLAATRPDLTEALKDGGHAGGTGSVRGARVRSVLVVSEVALSIVLLVGACLAIRGFVTMQMTDRGFQSERMLVIRVPLDAKRYPTFEPRNGFARDLLERLQRLPGVTGVTVGAPPQFDSSSGGQVPGQAKVENGIGVNFASEDYLRTLAIPLRRGRTFTADEIARGERVALINEAAMKLWPTGENPIDRTIQIDSLVGGGGNNLPAPNATKEVRVIGIVADVRTRDPLRAAGPVVIVPYTLRAPTNRNFLIKTQGEPTSVVNLVRAELRAMDRELPLLQPFTVEEVMNSQTAQPRFNMALFTALAAIALLLAAAGIYSVLSYHVAQRTREIGVRVALGASRSDILRLVMTAGGRLVGIGLVLGAAMSIALAKIITTQVFSVPLFDPLAMIAAVVLLSLAGMFACAVPGRRATKVHPMVALRTD